jgi:EAL domain-containing protein (putative c-di-GMP-specific phosphodiesterase class I)
MTTQALSAPRTPTDDLDWPAMLQWAIEGSGIRAVYQPIADLAGGGVAGYEALIRFVGYPVRHPEPWIAAARQHGCGPDLQAVALRAALADRDTLPDGCFLTVNVSPDVLGAGPVQRVWAEQDDLDGIVVELTEAATQPATVLRHLNRLRGAGARVAVDYAVHDPMVLRPDIIKVDCPDLTAAHLGLDAEILAENIEQPAELALARSLGVPLAQGYHLGRPARPWAPIIDGAAGR